MHCQSCGEKLRSRARFCNRCGKTVAERFGSALLSSIPATSSPAPDTPTENLSPKARTAPNQAAPSTLENQAMISTDQLGLRGTGRQSVPKSTSENVVPPMPDDARTTVVDAKPFRELAPTRPASLDDALAQKNIQPLTLAEAPAFIPPPPVAKLVASPPKIAPPASPSEQESVIEYVTPSTVELQRDLSNKPFFTRMLTPNAQNSQHQYLVYAVPLVLLAALIVLVAFLWLR
jgi:hypothetical protein